MAVTRKLVWDGSAQPKPVNSRDVVDLLQSIDRRLGYLLISFWLTIAVGGAFWVIRQAVVVAGW